jgi:hypothetical protein
MLSDNQIRLGIPLSVEEKPSKMTKQESYLHLWKGPFLVVAVAVSLIRPYIAQCSPEFLIQVSIAFGGLLWFCYDFYMYIESQMRSGLRRFIDSMVLDDVLRAIHDPETGLIACMVGTFVGTSSMYALRMNAEQRTKLVQASLWTTPNEARTILLSPGGCKSLLPEAMQTWLAKDVKEATVSKPGVEEAEDYEGKSDGSLSECDVMHEEDRSISSDVPQIRSRGLAFTEDSAASSAPDPEDSVRTDEQQSTQEPHCQPPGNDLIDPVATMFSILREMAFEQIKPSIQSFPESTVENVGLTAALALAFQLLLRMRCRRSLLGSLSAVSLSAVASAAFSTILARHAMLGNIHDRQTLQLVGKAIASRSLQKLKDMATYKGRWQGVLAMMVLILVGRRKSHVSSRASRR